MKDLKGETPGREEGGYLIPEFMDRRVEKPGEEAAKWREVLQRLYTWQYDIEVLVVKLRLIEKELEPLGFDIVTERTLDVLLRGRDKKA